jgi:hypothetical protein
MAKDVWDLQPFKNDKTGIGFIDKIGGAFKNIEVGKALGIGKPLDVQVGFMFDPKTRKIINTFHSGGKLIPKFQNPSSFISNIKKDIKDYYKPKFYNGVDPSLGYPSFGEALGHLSNVISGNTIQKKNDSLADAT